MRPFGVKVGVSLYNFLDICVNFEILFDTLVMCRKFTMKFKRFLDSPPNAVSLIKRILSYKPSLDYRGYYDSDRPLRMIPVSIVLGRFDQCRIFAFICTCHKSSIWRQWSGKTKIVPRYEISRRFSSIHVSSRTNHYLTEKLWRNSTGGTSMIPKDFFGGFVSKLKNDIEAQAISSIFIILGKTCAFAKSLTVTNTKVTVAFRDCKKSIKSIEKPNLSFFSQKKQKCRISSKNTVLPILPVLCNVEIAF